jgi:hypothetical protein
MLTKCNEIEIPAGKPFENDKLERQKIAENLTLLVQSTNQPFVISIEAPWGWGKTTFVKMWKAYLESLGHTCLYFNAWENDFVEDPLIAFVGEIGNAIVDKETKGKIKTELKKLQSMGGKIVRRTFPLAIQIASHGLLSQDAVKQTSDILFASGDEIANFVSEFAKDQIKQYEDDKKGIVEFKKELAKFAKSLSEGENKKGPLVFFIDELDRCRPDFSIALLEKVKHVFNAEGIVFILSIDREQIEQSIKSIYGQGMNADGYLRRFIDFRLRLPTPSTENFCNSLYDRFHMKEVFEKRRNGKEDQEALIQTFKKLAVAYQFSPRVIEQCFTEINLILRTTTLDTRLFPDLLAFLVAFKAYQPENYALLGKEMSYSKIQNLLSNIKQGFDLKDRDIWWLSAKIEAHMLYNYLKDKERDDAFNNLRSIAESKDHPEGQYAARILKFVEGFEWHEYSMTIQFLTSRLNAVADLTA